MPVSPGTAVGVRSQLILSALLSGVALQAGVQTYRELMVEHVDQLAADPTTDARAVDAADGGIDPVIVPPRMALALALMQVRVAARTPSPIIRTARLARADRLINRALEARSEWGEAWILATYASYVGDGPADPKTVAAFKRSLEASPYSITAAPWRIRYGLSQWDHLPPTTRMRVLEEAQWFGGLAPSYARLVRDALSTNPGARTFAAQRGPAWQFTYGFHLHAQAPAP